MQEFFQPDAPWNRRLWTVGTPLLLREVAEYASGVATGAMRPEGLAYICNSASEQVLRDTELDSEHGRAELVEQLREQAALNEKAAPSGPFLRPNAQAQMEERIRTAERGYLARWSSRIKDGTLPNKDEELVARLMAAHLLDIGFSQEHLQLWMKRMVGDGLSLSEILESASEMARKDAVDYEVWVPYESIPQSIVKEAGERYLSWSHFTQQLEARHIEQPKVKNPRGALRFNVVAREPRAALAAVEVEMRRLRSRCTVGQVGETRLVSDSGWALTINASSPRWKQLPRHGQIYLPSLAHHSGLLPSANGDATLDDALELLASVETSTSWASLASIWAALEGLLITDPREKGVLAADRAADIVTCSLPAAELRTLQHRAPFQTHNTASDFLEKLDKNSLADFTSEDESALKRLRTFHEEPETLIRARGYFRDSFRRLYNQRNLLMHAGRFDSIALPAAMRATPPLVGAAMDRIVNHRALEPTSSPVNLAARADLSLALLGKPGCRDVAHLLD